MPRSYRIDLGCLSQINGWLSLGLFLGLFLSSCQKDSGPGQGFSLDSLPLEKLSDYQLFEGTLSDLKPGQFLLPYDLNTPLFTDYAEKARFLYVPPGESISFQDDAMLNFPTGTLLFKNFYFPLDLRDPAAGKKILETRVLARFENEWKAYSYLWDDAQQDAKYRVTGGPVDVSWIELDGSTRSILYIIPNQVECQNCHQIGEPMFPLGPKPRNLNRSFAYEDGAMNQLEKWSEKGWLEGLPDPSIVNTIPVWNDPSTGTLDLRARAYLDINCAHCHRPEGDADNSGLFLNYENEDMSALGFCKPPVAAGGGSGGLQFGIVPGKPDSSILYFRMAATELDIRMPETGRSIVHEEGLVLISEWISSLSPEGCP